MSHLSHICLTRLSCDYTTTSKNILSIIGKDLKWLIGSVQALGNVHTMKSSNKTYHNPYCLTGTCLLEEIFYSFSQLRFSLYWRCDP